MTIEEPALNECMHEYIDMVDQRTISTRLHSLSSTLLVALMHEPLSSKRIKAVVKTTQ